MADPMSQRSLDYIARCDDPKQLRQIAANAAKQKNQEVREAARLRLYSVLPSEEPGSLEYDVWQSIYALEDTLTQERGKTMRLSRTRQKITRDKEAATVADLIMKRASDGFNMLVERKLIALTFEAISLKHPHRFDKKVLDAASARLSEVGYRTRDQS